MCQASNIIEAHHSRISLEGVEVSLYRGDLVGVIPSRMGADREQCSFDTVDSLEQFEQEVFEK